MTVNPSMETPGNGAPNGLAIRTEKLNLWYGTFQALFDVDFDVKRGIITALIGPSRRCCAASTASTSGWATYAPRAAST